MIPRRELLRRVPAVGAGLVAAATGRLAGSETPAFAHGVASGDPTAGSVVLWTRVSGAAGDEVVPVRWTLARDPELAEVVASGEAEAGPGGDWTVHVDAVDLEPATTWWYGFEARGQRSPTGRTRTAPASDDGRELRLGVVSCASYAAGTFDAYRHLAARDVDLVVHLGDYLYEGQSRQALRDHEPPQDPVSLGDYRRRHAQYKSDPDLQALHQQVAMASVWDDHEVAGNAWAGGAGDHNPRRQGPWSERRQAALQAYLEWMPLRPPDPADPLRIWRSLPLGASGELVLIDTRHDQRDRQVGSGGGDPASILDDPDRRIMSAGQEAWLAEHLRQGGGAWRVVANQVVLSPLSLAIPEGLGGLAGGLGVFVDGRVLNPDQWDGYPVARRRLLDVVAGETAAPVVFLTGDIHSSWAFAVPAGGRLGGEPVAVEAVVPSVSSPTFASIVGADAGLVADGLRNVVESQLQHLRWSEISHHGYLVVSLTPERLQGDWWLVDAVDGTGAGAGERLAASWAVAAGDPRWQEASALAPRPGPAGAAPAPSPERGPGTQVPGVVPYGLAAGAVLALGGAVLALRRRRR
ncbi:MAG TPA: alkaline phosphatase D family protein [Acidimicrobiales bacterium]|nr:alkaline phosphatase D family protein [Acidimicrobiales bacterium]